MAQLMDYTAYLAKEIGPRPAGTEEEQQAALYITERFQKEAGFTANIEEFTSAANPEAGRAILALVPILATILAIIFQVLAIPAFILSAVAAAIYILEELDRPIISRVLSRGASQNVLAKYQPNPEEPPSRRGHARKVVLVAHYDTGRVTPPLVARAQATGLPFAYIVMGGMCLAAFLLLVRIFIAAAGGIGLIVLNLLAVLSVVVCAIPVAKAVLMRSAPYNEGANNNATGTAALIEIARRISRGSVSEADLADTAGDVTIHGAAAAYEAGLVPDGAQLTYEAGIGAPPASLGLRTEEDRLVAAKAAIAAMTGKPVERKVYGSVASNLVNTHLPEGSDVGIMPEGFDPSSLSRGEAVPSDHDAQPARAPEPAAEEAADDLPADAEGFKNAPSWFIAAQKNAKRSDSEEEAPVQRSKVAEAMEHAERGRADREQEIADIRRQQEEAELQAREEEARASIEAARLAASPDGADRPSADTPTTRSAPTFDDALMQPVEAAEQPAGRTRTHGAGVNAIFGADEQDVAVAPSVADPNATVAHAPIPREAIDLPPIDEPPSAAQRIADLPSIAAEPVADESRASRLKSLRTNVPSLSGLISPVTTEDFRAEARRTAAASVPSVVNVPSPMEPDSGRESSSAETRPSSSAAHASARAAEPAVAASPDYDMDVPTTRAGGFLKKLRGRSGAELEETPQEWLDVDDDFDARSVGRARGSWESFRDDYDEDDGFGEFGTGDEKPRWNGGAYSRLQLGHVDMRSGEDAPADEMIPDVLPETEEGRSITGEIERIYHFRNPQFNTEIWFVAIGADDDAHSGVKAFLAEHADELRGSMVIEIESLGYGALSVASEEGRMRKLKASSRIKRYTRTATQATGIALDEVSLAGADSIASIIQKAGFQSMHLFGADHGKIAMKNSADDVMENIEELLLDEHVNFIFELLKR